MNDAQEPGEEMVKHPPLSVKVLRRRLHFVKSEDNEDVGDSSFGIPSLGALAFSYGPELRTSPGQISCLLPIRDNFVLANMQ